MQSRSKLERAHDLLLQGYANIAETVSLIDWLTNEVEDVKICVSGMSMGGLHAAYTVKSSRREIALATLAAPYSAVPVFCNPQLQLFKSVNWKHIPERPSQFSDLHKYSPGVNLWRELTPDQCKVDELARVLSLSDIRDWPDAQRPDAATFVFAKHDLYIPNDSATIFRHAFGSKASFQYIAGGHVSSLLSEEGRRVYLNAIIRSLTKLKQVLPR
jgi:hypothetical protein